MAGNTQKDPNDVSCSIQSKEQYYKYYQIYTMSISVVETTDSTTTASSISEVSWIQIYLEFSKDCQQIRQENHIRPETIQKYKKSFFIGETEVLKLSGNHEHKDMIELKKVC